MYNLKPNTDNFQLKTSSEIKFKFSNENHRRNPTEKKDFFNVFF